MHPKATRTLAMPQDASGNQQAGDEVHDLKVRAAGEGQRQA
jgi:hypothetical protein